MGKNFMSEETKYNYMIEFRKNLLEKIENPDFKVAITDLLKKVNFYKVKLTKNGFIYKSKEKEINISITEKDICYSYKEKKSNKITTGIYHVEPFGKIYTKYTETTTTIFKNVFQGKRNNLYDVHNIETTTKFQAYDENGYEVWRLDESKYDNYYINKITKEKIIREPNCFENYTEKQYLFRESQGIITKRIIKKYQHPEDDNNIKNEDSYLIQKTPYFSEKRLSRGGYYIWIKKEAFAKYKLGEKTVKELWNSRGRVRKIERHII